jgi:S1-C subfamily serine protease
MKKQFTILFFLLLFSSSLLITKNVFASCASPASRGYKQCGERERYAIDSWYANQKAELRRNGRTFSGAAIELDNQYQQKISWCEEDNNNYVKASNDYEECLKQEATIRRQLEEQSHAPACLSDTWQCGNWNPCSPQGIQTRSCNKTFDCSSTETASPATSQYCEAQNKPQSQTPSENLGIANQDSIVKATVKLICPVNSTTASQGSGTVIDSKGTILTNKHVIDGTSGCLVGFIETYGDEPYFADRQIADIYKVSNNDDIAILKLRNPSNKSLTSVNITEGSSSNLNLGDQITTYGYPAKFGTKITYTSGDFSGIDGNYLKTTAIIEHGNSGGGAYLKNGMFIGIPSAVVKGSLNSIGYILSINEINNWLENSPVAYDSGSTNDYSRVSSILENIDLNTLSSLNLFVADNNESNKTTNTNNNQNISVTLQNRLKGYILLQIESKGEAWYVNPSDGKRYYMKDGATAYEIMRKFGLGITDIDLTKVPQENGKNNNPSLVNKLKGKILLQVQSHGEAWYVNPKTGYRYYMVNGEAAYNLMRNYSLGITNSDLEKIPIGNL